jgi:FAD/FMN-containing dehydrogenase
MTGIGKARKQWMTETVSAPGVAMLKAVKRSLDPTNVFAINNLVDHNLPEDELL